MGAEGFYLVQGDKTTCGGKITTGAEDHTLFDKPVAREQDSVTCGKHAGLYRIAGGIDNDTIHGRRMAGTLDSYSSCPCKAKFIPSMMDDTYEKSGDSANSAGGTTTAAATATSSATTPTVTTTGQSSDLKSKLHCQHTDGAIKVADYILNEIKTNVRGRFANVIRGYIDDETIKNAKKEWDNLPFYAKLAPRPEPHLSEAIIVWHQTVKTGSVWDHKPKIRDMFGSVAVARPLPPPSRTPSKSYYHKFKQYDYFYDVWSNIHYGYVGLSVGFSEWELLKGSSLEQHMTPGAEGDDTLDDITSMKIGFSLYHRFGKMADALTAQDILDALDNTPQTSMPVSKQKHWCWNEDNPDEIGK
ncbi:polymorphic toxin type 44 domain-containing protein [Franconibacter sp. IITDAS19]|uniref:polymorphic toxin type 44 domain-containing protein n=1 Tax=Franconibacter sp. IITDAS19 TaxID=2930569 RepID=UPI001FFB8648|nr:polymorphic toxin type 44 domain-containing protein [Franconibacter sp. IITDAS19]MCK1970529.1 polymorphic toxin type 44 domain-containing protein [Franconibacter sp. IITDAS19]